MTLHETMRNHAFTRGLSDAQIAALASIACEVAFEENEVVLVDRERSRSFFLLLTGSVVVELRAPAYVVAVEALVPGQVFGWSALLEDSDTLFQVRAREHTTALRLDGAALRPRAARIRFSAMEILQRALAVVAGRVRATESALRKCAACESERNRPLWNPLELDFALLGLASLRDDDIADDAVAIHGHRESVDRAIGGSDLGGDLIAGDLAVCHGPLLILVRAARARDGGAGLLQDHKGGARLFSRSVGADRGERSGPFAGYVGGGRGHHQGQQQECASKKFHVSSSQELRGAGRFRSKDFPGPYCGTPGSRQ